VKRLVLRSERGDGRFSSLGASVCDGFPDKEREVRVDGLSRGGNGFTKNRARQRLVEKPPDVDNSKILASWRMPADVERALLLARYNDFQ
jgi:hypothetical protein